MSVSFPPQLVEKFISTFKASENKKQKIVPTRIKVNGQFVTLQSGKTLWRNVGHAKNALRNHINCSSFQWEKTLLKYHPELGENALWARFAYIPSKTSNEWWHLFLEYLQQEGVLEFVQDLPQEVIAVKQ